MMQNRLGVELHITAHNEIDKAIRIWAGAEKTGEGWLRVAMQKQWAMVVESLSKRSICQSSRDRDRENVS